MGFKKSIVPSDSHLRMVFFSLYDLSDPFVQETTGFYMKGLIKLFIVIIAMSLGRDISL
jgi:hypothetical protein